MQRLAERLSVRAGNPDSHKRKARYLRYASSHCGLYYFFLVLLMLLKGGCRQHDPDCAADATQGHARSPPDIQLPERENEMSSVCERREAMWLCVRACERICVSVCGGKGENREDGVAVKVVSCTGQK